MWKEKIRNQLQQAVRHNNISKFVAYGIREALEGNKEIKLLYNNSREQYMGFFFTEEKKNRFDRSTREALKRFVKAGFKDAIDEMKKRIKNKTW